MQLNLTKLYAVLSANTLLRTAMTASGSNALIGFYLALLAKQGADIDASTAGNLNAFFDASALLLAIPFGALIDRYSPRLVLVIGSLVGALATQLFGLTGAVAIFFVSRSLEGVGQSATQPGILAYLTDATQDVPEKRGRVMSWFEISLFLGIALGNLVSGTLWERFNTQAFGILAFFYLIAAVVFLWGTAGEQRARRQEAGETRRSALAGFREAMSNQTLQRLALPWLLFNLVVGLWLSQFAFQLNGPEREGQWIVGRLTAEQIAIFLFLYTIVFAAGVYYYGLQIGRISRTYIMRIAFIAMYGTSICFFLVNSSASWPDWTRWLLLAPYMLAIAVQGGFTPAALSYLADVAGKSGGRGSAMGFYTLLLSLGNIIGSLLGGQLGSRYALNGIVAATLVFATLGVLSLRAVPEEDLLVKV